MRKRLASLISPISVVTLALATAADGSLIINAPQQIRQAIRVNVIRVADDAGGQAAPAFGTATQQASLFANVDTIWSQAGIDLQFKIRPGTYNSSFALGTPGSTTVRDQFDLNQIVSNARSIGILDPDPGVLNLFQVRVVPGFNQRNDTTSNGLAFVDGNGITFWTGPTLPAFADGLELVAKVLAHEIGHNLGLPHLADTQNLMQASSSDYHEARLTSGQIATAKSSQFAIVLGDATGDDIVNFDDLVPLAQNYNSATGQTLADGDFTFDGAVNFDDLVVLAQNYNYNFTGGSFQALGGGADFDGDWATAQSLVPEPTSVALLAPCLLALVRKRRPVRTIR